MAHKLTTDSLDLFRDCPRCFWLEVSRGIERPKVPFLSLAPSLKKEIMKFFDKYRDRNEFPPFLKGKIEGKLIFNPLREALHFEDLANNLIFSGHLDEVVILRGGSAAPLAHKIEPLFPDKIPPSCQFQMNCQSFLLEKSGYPVSNKSFLVYYIPLSLYTLEEGIELEPHVLEVTTNPREVEDILHNALEVLKWTIADPNPDCPFCKWAREAIF